MKTKILNHKRIESYLPVFPGFYGTIFEPQEDHLIEHPYTFDDYDFDYKQYNIDMTKACVGATGSQLKEIGIRGITITWQSISSPREYNFANDSINVLYELTEESLEDLDRYIAEHSKSFQKYLTKHFTSYSGFMSFYSPDMNVWLDEYLTDKKQLRTCFGALLEFIFEEEGYDDEQLYYACDYVCLDGGLKKSILDDIDGKIEQYSKENYLNSDVTTITRELIDYFKDEKFSKYKWLDYSYIEEKVKQVFSEFASTTLKLFKDANA